MIAWQERLLKSEMPFADAGSGKAGLAQTRGGGAHVFVGGKAMDAVAVAVLAMGVAVLAGENAGAADGAGGAGAEGPVEDDALPGKGVDVRGLDGGIAVAGGQARPVVGDEEEDVAVCGHGWPPGAGRILTGFLEQLSQYPPDIIFFHLRTQSFIPGVGALFCALAALRARPRATRRRPDIQWRRPATAGAAATARRGWLWGWCGGRSCAWCGRH